MDTTVFFLTLLLLGTLWLVSAKRLYTYGELHAVVLGAMSPVYAAAPIILLCQVGAVVSVSTVALGVVAIIAAVAASFVSFMNRTLLTAIQEERFVRVAILVHLATMVLLFALV